MSKHKQKMPRREFVKVAAATVAALPAARYARILGANDRVRVGIVGFSDRFRQALLPAFGKVGKELNFEIVAVSDLWNRRRDEGVAGHVERRVLVGAGAAAGDAHRDDLAAGARPLGEGAADRELLVVGMRVDAHRPLGGGRLLRLRLGGHGPET